MAPFAAASKNLEMEENPTSSMVIPTVIGIEKVPSKLLPHFVTSCQNRAIGISEKAITVCL